MRSGLTLAGVWLFLKEILQQILKWTGGGEFLVQRPIWERAAKMGLKISPPGIAMTPYSMQNWYKHGLYFQNFPKFAWKLAQFHQADTKIVLKA